jgi:hypothetical protein
MKCTQILEKADPHTWQDNFLCLGNDMPYNFHWSSAGRINGKSCVQWLEAADPNTWRDNFLCEGKKERKSITIFFTCLTFTLKKL